MSLQYYTGSRGVKSSIFGIELVRKHHRYPIFKATVAQNKDLKDIVKVELKKRKRYEIEKKILYT